MIDSASVSSNTATEGSGGGGITNLDRVTLFGSASVSGNSGSEGAGGILNIAGKVTLNNKSSVDGNMTVHGNGGGIYNRSRGAVTMNGASTITGNVAGPLGAGGGIFNNLGTLVGAVDGGNVFNNTPDNIFP
jgi:hypothetical protein